MNGYVQQFYASDATTNATSLAFSREGSIWNYQGIINGTGAVSATVTVQVSNDGTNWETFGTLTLTGTTTDTDTVSGNAPWRLHRCVISGITAGNSVNVYGIGV